MKAGNVKNARELSIIILNKIITNQGFANLAVDSYLEESQLNKLERAFTTQLVYGVTRHYNTLEWILEQFIGVKIKKLKPLIKNILLTGIYQIIYLNKIPDSAVCNEGCKLARKYGHQGVVAFVNGVLRNVVRQKNKLPYPDAAKDPITHIAIKFSHPEWLVARWLTRYGFADTVKLCEKNNEPAKVWLRCNTLRVNMEELRAKLDNEGITTTLSTYAPEGISISNFDKIVNLPGYEDGLFIIQDESSMVVSHAVNPQTGARVIDACGGPGGKTTHLAQIMKNQGNIKSFDIYQHKVKLIKANCSRLGISIVEAECLDATALHEDYFNWADFVLVDAPCSGTGVLGRRPDARWRKSPAQLKELPKLQYQILTSASQAVKPGGVLVYSTCSIEPEENLQVLHNFLKNNANFVAEDLSPLLPFELATAEKQSAAKGYFQFLPHLHGTDGFFVTRMKKLAQI